MTHEKLLKQLEQWQSDGKFAEVENAVLALPEAERDYALLSQLARALNNLSRYAEALALMESDSMREPGQTDALWHYRTGYSLYYLDREAESIPRLERAIELGDHHPGTYKLLLYAKQAVDKSFAANTGAGKTDGGDQPRLTFVPKAIATLELNMRLHPDTRTGAYEDGLDFMLRSMKLGYVNGGGSKRTPEGEIESCSIEIMLAEDSEETRRAILGVAEKSDVAKGSRLKYRSLAGGDAAEYPIGAMEGFAVYLNNTDLPDEVLKKHKPNEVAGKLRDILAVNGALAFSHWNGPTETALYYYGEGGADAMLAKAEPFLKTHPRCEKCRIVRLV